jgi:5,10-methylenetetrahydrofolate reductase
MAASAFEEVSLSKLSAALRSGRFVVTSELNPPKGTDVGPVLQRAEMLKGTVDAFNITDSHAARMSMAPLAVAHLLLDRGIEPIMQMTSRDRNRIALQGDLLGAAALGVSNVVFMGGDPPGVGDHPDAKPVFDLLSVELIKAARSLESGRDYAGNTLSGAPKFCLGAVVNPGAENRRDEVDRMRQKRDAGAEFFQTQAIYDPARLESFIEAARGIEAAVLAGVIMLKSAKMAQYMNENVPGIEVPDALIEEIDAAEDKAAASIAITARVIARIRPLCGGVHIMPLGWEDKIPAVLEAVSALTSEG